ncbi:zinc ribbon domain-containing protein [Paenibacillus marinisediminis]
MNRFLQKMKDGASKASEKAQNVMELNRVQAQIDSRLKELKNNTYEIGYLAFEAYKEQDMESLSTKIEQLAEVNMALEQEIEQLEWKRCELRNEKRCDCGQTAAWEANFCAKCGAKLPDPPKFTHEMAATMEPVEEFVEFEVQELRPYRHNESAMTPIEYTEDADPYYNDQDEQALPGYSAAQTEEEQKRSAGSTINGHKQENTWTWNFPEKEPLLRANRHLTESQVDPNQQICKHCNAKADLEAKWCERCGTPFI